MYWLVSQTSSFLSSQLCRGFHLLFKATPDFPLASQAKFIISSEKTFHPPTVPRSYTPVSLSAWLLHRTFLVLYHGKWIWVSLSNGYGYLSAMDEQGPLTFRRATSVFRELLAKPSYLMFPKHTHKIPCLDVFAHGVLFTMNDPSLDI